MISETALGQIQKTIVRIAANKLRRSGDAEDVAQDVVIVLTQKYSEVNDVDELLKLAKATMQNKVLSIWSRLGRRKHVDLGEGPDLVDPGPDPERVAWIRKRAEIFATVLKNIDEPCRTILRMKAQGAKVDAIRVATNNQNQPNDISVKINRCVKQAATMVRQRLEVVNA